MALDLDALVLAPCFATFGEVNRGNPIPVYTPQGGAAFDIDGVFRLPSETVLGMSDAPGITTRKPVLDIRASQLPIGVRPAQGDQVVARGVTYLVSDARPDGDGLITLDLAEA